jgi:UDP-N-acetylmuramoylalanine--D-glutamate ligase
MEPYVADKKLIYADQVPGSYTLCNRDDEWGPVFARETRARARWYSARPLPPGAEGAWLEPDGRGMMNAVPGAEAREAAEILPRELAVPARTCGKTS